MADDAVGEARRGEALGELHTLKGEARMLGWTLLATLAHELEGCLREAEPDAEAISAVLDSLLLSLSPDTDQKSAEDMWRTALVALGVSVEEEMGESPGEDSPDPGTKPQVSPREVETWMQVKTKTVDDLGESLANLTGEFSKFANRSTGSTHQGAAQKQELELEFERLRTLLSDALLLALELRLTPVEPLLRRIAAHARLLGAERGKSLRVQVRSQGAQIERALMDRLGEPLLHLINNAVDHGLEHAGTRGDKDEVATIRIVAEPEGAFVALRVEDDGRGIDERAVLARARARGLVSDTGSGQRALDLLFEPGFSTKETIDEVSGRGVGLDVVKRGVEALGGSISIQTELGQGTTFTLLIPAALTQERLLVVRSGTTLYGISGHLVLSVEQKQETKNFSYQGEFLPRRTLSSILGSQLDEEESTVCIIQFEGKSFALGCQEVLGHFELIRRPTGPKLANFSGVSGSAQTDEGELVLLLDPRALKRGLTREARASSPLRERPTAERLRVLVVDDSVVVRDLLSEVLTSEGYQVRTARNGREALSEMDSFAPSLVLSDVEMPEMDGFRLLEVLRRRSETLPIILVTARSSAADRARAEALGVTAYVTKGDFQSESLVKVVGRFISEAR
jgi:chemosensory pili system protein ChpA (sensor histidine kinase/response regulator)